MEIRTALGVTGALCPSPLGIKLHSHSTVFKTNATRVCGFECSLVTANSAPCGRSARSLGVMSSLATRLQRDVTL